jgi:N-acetylmuramoyl-L-alanine amidase
MSNKEDSQKKVLEVLVAQLKKTGQDYKTYENDLKEFTQDTKSSVKVPQEIKQDTKQKENKQTQELKKIEYKEGSLKLIFSKSLDDEDVSNFDIDTKKGYKAIFDIKAILKADENYKNIRVGQYKPNITRIVIEDKSKFKADFKINKNILTINYQIKKPKKESSDNGNNLLTGIKLENKKLVLVFSQDLNKDDIKHFQWTQKKYRDIYEINGNIQTKDQKTISPRGITQIRVAQFEPNIIRVVFTDEKFLKTSFSIDGNKLIIACKQISTRVMKPQKSDEDIISSVNTVNNSLVLLNSRKIDDIKKSKYKLDNGQVLTIFAIKAKLKPFNKKNFKLKNVDEVKVLRYSPTVTRIVFADKKPIDVSYHISNNKIVFTSKRLSNKSVPVKKQASIMKRKGKIIVIDPGHGGRDSGAIGVSRYQEKKLVYNIAREARRILKQKGYTVYLTRYKDKFLKLKNRTEYANDKNADIFVSIHANSIVKSKQKTTQGVETFFLSPSRSARAKRVALTENQADTKDMNWYSKNLTSTLLVRSNMVASNKLAIDVQSNMLSSLKTKYNNVKDMGVRKGPFWILVGAMMPSILVEVGYITHPVEGKRLQSKQYQNLLSKGIADGIDSYFLKNN